MAFNHLWQPAHTQSASDLATSSGKVKGLVTLHAYDLGWLTPLTEAVGVGAFHVTVEVNRREFFFADTGVCQTKLKQGSERRSSVVLGATALSANEVVAVIRQLRKEFKGEEYHLVKKNCQTFAEAFCARLGVAYNVPEHYKRYAHSSYVGALSKLPVAALSNLSCLPVCLESENVSLRENIMQAMLPLSYKETYKSDTDNGSTYFRVY